MRSLHVICGLGPLPIKNPGYIYDTIMRSESDMFVKIKSNWMERISKDVWNHFNFGKWSSNIENDQNLRNQSLQFHLSQIAINCQIHNKARMI